MIDPNWNPNCVTNCCTRKIFLPFSRFKRGKISSPCGTIFLTMLGYREGEGKRKMIEALRHFSKIIPRWSDKREQTTNYRSEPIRSQRRTGSKVLSYLRSASSLSAEEVTSRTIPRFQPQTRTHTHTHTYTGGGVYTRLDRTYISILS